jgi:hypothetical protein
MSFVEADAFIRKYEPKVRDMLQAAGGGYDKLDYTIYIKRDDNEIYPIKDRYDIGDSKKVSGFYNVLKAKMDYYYSHPEIYSQSESHEHSAENKKRLYEDLAILKKAMIRDYPHVEIEKLHDGFVDALGRWQLDVKCLTAEELRIALDISEPAKPEKHMPDDGMERYSQNKPHTNDDWDNDWDDEI